MNHIISQLKKNITYLEFANAEMIKELFEADRILREAGFEHGLMTVKTAAQEIIRMQSQYKPLQNEEI
jgi:hypothetical protein